MCPREGYDVTITLARSIRTASFAALAAVAVMLPTDPSLAESFPIERPAPGSKAEELLDRYLNLIEPFLESPQIGMTMAVTSPVTAIEDGDEVVITMPGVTVYYTGATAEGMGQLTGRFGEHILLMGDMVTRVSDLGGGRFRMVTDMPNRMELLDQGQELIMAIEQTQPTSEAIYHDSLEGVGDYTAQIEELRIVLAEQPDDVVLAVGRLVAEQSFEEISDSRADVTTQFRAEGIAIVPPDGTPPVEIVELSYRQTGEGWPLDLLQQAMSPRRAMANIGTANAGEPSQQMIDFIRSGDFSSAEMAMSLSGLDTTAPDGSPVALDALSFSLSGEGGDNGSLAIAWAASGVSGNPPGIPPEVIPTEARLTLSAQDVPWSAVGPSLADAMSGMPPGDPMMLLGMLGQAGTFVSLDELAIDSEAIGLTGSGQANVDSTAALGVAGSFQFQAVGLDTAMQLIGNLPPEMQGQAMPVIAMARGFGQPTTSADGRPALDYAIDIGADGSLSVNGQPMLGGPPPQ